ncbi:IQ domain-containing protein C [Pundamilia nyererei]|uniref:IQ domain-containing protein C n=1 Tax=Pundamilia nyererei TaxID=303518 RepID=A0A9Y3VCS2_9CICH|nr:PREDICTED: IQ domain-containing protein C [Pundamilia nyererei]XP_005925742.1 IQ domain-containing protein C [Haplochromis burtoni]
MERSKWEKTIVNLQACSRGYLVRKEVCKAREDFEDIVKEIDGRLTHLKWTDTLISIPQFIDTGSLRPPPSSPATKPLNPETDVSATPQIPALSPENRDHHCALLEKTEAERDDSQTCLPSSSSIRGEGEGQRQSGVVESTAGSSSVWSSVELDMNYTQSHKGSHRYCLTQEVPRTPEALRFHRSTLTMELLWLQQAIDSRKKYLSLKDKLSAS